MCMNNLLIISISFYFCVVVADKNSFQDINSEKSFRDKFSNNPVKEIEPQIAVKIRNRRQSTDCDTLTEAIQETSLKKINQFRAEKQLSELKQDPELENKARKLAENVDVEAQEHEYKWSTSESEYEVSLKKDSSGVFESSDTKLNPLYILGTLGDLSDEGKESRKIFEETDIDLVGSASCKFSLDDGKVTYIVAFAFGNSKSSSQTTSSSQQSTDSILITDLSTSTSQSDSSSSVTETSNSHTESSSITDKITSDVADDEISTLSTNRVFRTTDETETFKDSGFVSLIKTFLIVLFLFLAVLLLVFLVVSCYWIYVLLNRK